MHCVLQLFVNTIVILVCWCRYKYILTCKDHFSAFVWLFPLKSKTKVEVVRNLRMAFRWFGAPRILQADNGSLLFVLYKHTCTHTHAHTHTHTHSQSVHLGQVRSLKALQRTHPDPDLPNPLQARKRDQIRMAQPAWNTIGAKNSTKSLLRSSDR